MKSVKTRKSKPESFSRLGIFNQSKRSDIIIRDQPPLAASFDEHGYMLFYLMI